MAQQIIIPASSTPTRLDILNGAQFIPTPATFPASASDLILQAVLTDITTTSTTTSTTSTTTTKPPQTDYTIFGTAAVTSPKLNDGESLELGVKFKASQAGVIKGIRFYKIAGTTGTHTASLWSSATTKLASATFIGETASGWQEVLFSTPVPINASVTYTVSVYYTSGDYIGKLNGLATVISNGPLSTIVGTNGVFKYGTTGFPSLSYQNSNYYVDVIFSTSVGPTPTTTSTTSTTTRVAPPPPSGIQGFGAQAVGGTTIVNVATKAQFDAALGSGKYIKFTSDVTFTDRVDITYSNLTIDGNGHNVTINNGNNGDGISFNGPNAHHCILREIRVINSGGDGINVIDGAHDIAIDHCSSYDNRDGNIDVAGDTVGLTKNVTVQWCFIGRGAANNGSYSGCSLITGQNVTFHHNLFAPATVGGVGERCPLTHSNYSPVGSPNADVRNNLIWRYGRDDGTGSGFGIDSAYGAASNAVNNYVYTTGGDTGNGVTTSAYGEPSGSLYATGNISGNGVNANSKNNHTEYAIPAWAQVTIKDACSAAREIVQGAGVSIRDAVEQAVINGINLPNCP